MTFSIMKQKLLLMIICIVYTCFAYGESSDINNVFVVIETTINHITDCSSKQFICLSAKGYDPNACILFIDYTEDNNYIVAVDGETAMLVYPFERNELANCIVELLLRFETLEEQLPVGRYLQYDLKLSEEETYYITKENLYDFIAMLISSSGNKKTTETQKDTSSIPFENLEFSNFLYEEHPNGNASISGIVENHNNYAVDGYFYILFYENNKLVHTELSALPTIPAGASGVWSDLIYDIDYDCIEYADCNVNRR